MNPLTIDADVPPAARHVAHVLQEEGPLTRRDIIELTGHKERTADQALADLREAGVVSYRKTWCDARCWSYDIITC